MWHWVSDDLKIAISGIEKKEEEKENRRMSRNGNGMSGDVVS